MLTLKEAVALAAEKYHKTPAFYTLKTAAQEGRLKAVKAMTPHNLVGWMVREEDLAEYLTTWTPGQAAPPGNKRRQGSHHTPETKEQIGRSVSRTKSKSKDRL